MVFTNEIKEFAKGNLDYFEAFSDYYFNEAKRTAENAELVQKAFFEEIERRSGVARTEENMDSWASNPMVQWAGLAIIDATINSVLPQTINESMGLFTDLRMVGAGDIVRLKIRPRTLFTVTRGGMGERTTFRQKNYEGDIVLAPEMHIVTVYVDMFRVFAGKEDLAEFVRMVVLSVETAMGKDAANALETGLSGASYPSSLKVSGAFNAQRLIQLCQRVQAYNFGVKPMILGTAVALSHIVPDSSLGYRGNYDAANGVIRVMKDFYGFTPVELPQYAAGETPDDGVALSDNVLYIVSPAFGKLVQGVVSTTLTNSNQFYENADLTQNYTQRKAWNFTFASAVWAGKYTITE